MAGNADGRRPTGRKQGVLPAASERFASGEQAFCQHAAGESEAAGSPAIYGRFDCRKSSSETTVRAARPSSSPVRRWPTECHGVTSASSGMISKT